MDNIFIPVPDHLKRQFNFWRFKQSEIEVRGQFNLELYIRALEARKMP